MRFLITLLLVASIAGTAHAQNGKAPWEAYGDRITASQEVAVLGDDLFGDNVSLANGALSFSATDVSLPGHGPAISLGREYQIRDWRYRKTDGMFGDWDASVPQISGVFLQDWVDSAGGTSRCSVGGAPSQNGSSGIHPIDYWQGLSIQIPGVGGGELLRTISGAPIPSGGTAYPYLTNDHIRISCLTTIKNGSGQGFLAITPDGTKYWFDWMAQHHEPELRRGSTTIVLHPSVQTPREYTIQARRNVLYATRVEDRFGNVVTYTYTNDADDPGKLTKINTGGVNGVGGDGRQITVNWTGAKVSSVTDGTRTWTYGYATTTGNRTTLTSVDTPGEGAWTIDFDLFTDAEIKYRETFQDEQYRRCQQNEIPQNYDNVPVGTITHPSGAVGTFTTAIIEHRRSNVPLSCNNVKTLAGHPPGGGNNTNDDSAFWPFEYDAYTITAKTISGLGTPTANWTYEYQSDRSFVMHTGTSPNYPVCVAGWNTCIAPTCVTENCAGRARTIVRGPEGGWTRYSHGNSYRYDEGKLVRIETGAGAGPAITLDGNGNATNALRATRFTYDLSTTNGTYWKRWGMGHRGNGDSYPNEYHRPLTKTEIFQQGEIFTNQVLTLSRFAMATSVTRFNSLGYSRTDFTAYLDDSVTDAKWVVGLVASETNDELDIVTAKTTYHTGSLLPHQSYWPHAIGDLSPQVQQTLAWYADGQLQSVKDGEDNETLLSDWYRGVPRAIDYPDGTDHAAQVNVLGQVTQITDQNGWATNYSYDARGLLASIAYPTGDSVAWNATTLDFVKTTGSEYGFPAGTWRRTVSTANGRKVTWFDALWRPVMTREYDTGNPTGTQRFNATVYDAAGRQMFNGYPRASASSVASFVAGVDTEYDVLGRVIAVTQDDGTANGLVTLTEYLADFETRVTNPRGKQTTTRFFAWDQPDTSRPEEILAPLNVRTEIIRDALGRTARVTRHGDWAGVTTAVDRVYRYNARGLLERRYSAEERSTYFDYDFAGNLVASYQCGGDTDSACGWVPGGGWTTDVTTRTYDAMNRLTLVDYPTGTTDVATTYTLDGLPATITAGTVVQAYTYNRRRLLVSERLTGVDAIDWKTDYGYNANGHPSTLTYDDGHAVNYAPNALGQPTQAGTYATGVQYFPNGAVKQFTYGNGIVHVLTQNARGLPETSVDEGAVTVIDDTYLYDANGNVEHIVDGLPGAPGTREMHYDDLDRLIEVEAGSDQGGNAVFSYDGLDNIRVLDQASRQFRHQYNGTNRLSEVRDPLGATLFTLTYDIRGNQVKRTAGGLSDTFTFDKANRLVATSIREGSVPVASTYLYDGLGRRVRETRIDHTYSGYNQAGQLLHQRDLKAATDTDHTYVYLAGSLVAERTKPVDGGATTVEYQHTDALGSPVATTSAVGGIVARNRQTAYGEPADGTWESGPGYTGHVVDAGARVVYMQQRYYDPVIGRFLSIDPVGADGVTGANFNRYTYASSNPYSRVDPDGRRDIYIGGAGDKRFGRAVQAYAEAQQRLYPDRDIQYFSHRQTKKIKQAMTAPLAEGEPLNVAGHSMGGKKALQLAKETGVIITNLVTVDPVGSTGDGSKPENVQYWTNVIANPAEEDRNLSDGVASAGRRMLGETDTSGADHSSNSTTNHAEFPDMMDESGAAGRIEESYIEEPAQ